jgi:tetratricopeptide (TPR) repeat protein
MVSASGPGASGGGAARASGTRRCRAAVCGVVVGAALVLVWSRHERPVFPAAPSLGTPGGPSTSREDLRKTVDAMEARLRASPTDRAAAVTLAEALWRQSRSTGNGGLVIRAEQALRRAIEQEPADYEARRVLSTVLTSQHRFHDAIAEATRAAAVGARDAWIHGVLADAHLELGNYEEAFDEIDRMMALRPDAGAYARASYAREIQGDLPGAGALMRMAAEATSPHDPEGLAWCHAQLGHLDLLAGNIPDARRRFRRAEVAFPGHPAAGLGLVRAAVEAKEMETALAIGEPLFRASPAPDLADQLGRAARGLGRHAAADRYDALAEQMWRYDMPDARALARFLASRGSKIPDALAAAERARESRRDIFTDDALAWALYQSGRLDEAREAARRALRTGSQDPEIRTHAAAIERVVAERGR